LIKIVLLESNLLILENRGIYFFYFFSYFVWSERIFTVLNLISFAIYDYSGRIFPELVNQKTNDLSYGLELICNIFFIL